MLRYHGTPITVITTSIVDIDAKKLVKLVHTSKYIVIQSFWFGSWLACIQDGAKVIAKS